MFSTYTNYFCFFFSKCDERSDSAGLKNILPTHEYFHQQMNTADCQSELSRNGSRGLEGGYFLHAQHLNRTEILTAPGKHAINSFKDFASINAEARFSQFFIASNNIEDTTIDNTPEEIKKSSKEEKVGFFHRLVANSLKDLLPVFKTSSLDSDINQLLYDHPVQSRRRKPLVSSNNHITSSKLDCGRTVSADEAQTFVSTHPVYIYLPRICLGVI